jgi:ATP-dependent DNA helicase RecQ
MDPPESLEAYYQEAGRAGRDEQKSYAVLLYNPADREEMEMRMESTFPDIRRIRNCYQALGNFFGLPIGSGKGASYDFDLGEFCDTYSLPLSETFNCIRFLELQGLISTNESVDLHSRIRITYRPDDLYEFQVKNPSYDHFLKTILRSYEGVFDDYVMIKEDELARRAVLTKDEVIRQLGILHKNQVISYIPSNDKPQLTYLEERLDLNDLHIDRENLADRKKRFIERARAMLNYAEMKHHCRSQMLVAYFGEKDTVRCGVCDYCLERNKADLSDFEFDQIQANIKSVLMKNPIGLQELIEHIQPAGENKAIRVIEWMIDNEEIRYIDGDKLVVSS